MKPVRSSVLTAAFLAVVTLLVAAFGGYVMVELSRVEGRIHLQEVATARLEVQQAADALDRRMQDMTTTPARWDETRRQLVYGQ
jgi:sensor domain CHASE-containing protein